MLNSRRLLLLTLILGSNHRRRCGWRRIGVCCVGRVHPLRLLGLGLSRCSSNGRGRSGNVLWRGGDGRGRSRNRIGCRSRAHRSRGSRCRRRRRPDGNGAAGGRRRRNPDHVRVVAKAGGAGLHNRSVLVEGKQRGGGVEGKQRGGGGGRETRRRVTCETVTQTQGPDNPWICLGNRWSESLPCPHLPPRPSPQDQISLRER